MKPPSPTHGRLLRRQGRPVDSRKGLRRSVVEPRSARAVAIYLKFHFRFPKNCPDASHIFRNRTYLLLELAIAYFHNCPTDGALFCSSYLLPDGMALLLISLLIM